MKERTAAHDYRAAYTAANVAVDAAHRAYEAAKREYIAAQDAVTYAKRKLNAALTAQDAAAQLCLDADLERRDATWDATVATYNAEQTGVAKTQEKRN